jgi:hypothetical protein
MTNAIVMNTMNAAVTEYENFEFQSITPTHAGGATGLFLLGGDLDIDQPIVGAIQTGKTLIDEMRKKYVDLVHFAMTGDGTAACAVVGANASYSYDFPVRDTGVSRSQPGRGIRENYLAFGMTKTDGGDFQLDKIDVSVVSSATRKV